MDMKQKSIYEFVNNNFSDEYFSKFNIIDLVWQFRTIHGQNLKKAINQI